jgi:hypothetical protein
MVLGVPLVLSQYREAHMIAIAQLATLIVTTVFAAAAAAALHGFLLRAMFVLMRPATARRVPAATQLVRRTPQLAKVYATVHR